MEMSVSSALKLGSVLSALGLGYADMGSFNRNLFRLGMNWIISSIFGIRDRLYGISKVQDAHLETLTLTSALNSVSEFGFRIFSYGFISTAALDMSCFDSTADFICYLDLDFL
ncbi:unnamed protein product [Rhizophagus irregularis]|nr:unnamed protein product [Rhizophagus irregularis]